MSKISDAILKVSFSVGHIKKLGKAEFGQTRYNFQAWEDVLPAVRDACVEHGLSVIPNVREIQRSLTVYTDNYGKEKQVPKVTVLMRFTLIAGDESMEFSFMGESLDTDDKSIQKAVTSATKYFFLKTFMIPIAGEVDPDSLPGNLDQLEKPKPLPNTKPKEVPEHRKIMMSWGATEEDQAKVINVCRDRGTKASELVPEAKAAGVTDLATFYEYIGEDAK
jgi:hypothetical protein